MRKVKYMINYLDLGVSYQDSGRWRSYELNAGGDTREELLADATISEIDQDGGDLACYGIEGCDSEVEKAVLSAIDEALALEMKNDG